MGNANRLLGLVLLVLAVSLSAFFITTRNPNGSDPHQPSAPAPLATPTISEPLSSPPGIANTPPASLPITPASRKESPGATYAPDPTLRSVTWLLDQVQSAQVITITALDAPELQVRANGALRQQLEQAITDQTQAITVSTEWLNAVLPYPNYQILLQAPGYETTINWVGRSYIAVNRHPTDSSTEQDVNAYYFQATAALWDALAVAAAPPHYGPETLRYLLQASGVTRDVAGQMHTYPPDVMIRVARVLSRGTPSTKPSPTIPPQMILHFTVEGREQEVQVWESDFTYGEHIYHLELAMLSIIRSAP